MGRSQIAGCAAFLLLVVGCSSAATEADEAVVVATTSIWADILSNVACGVDGREPVGSLVEPGDDPHGSTLTLADRDHLGHAELIVGNGLGLEPQLESLLADLDARSILVADLLESEVVLDGNPHIWMDPLMVESVLSDLGDQLISVGFDAQSVQQCAESYSDELIALDQEVLAELDAVPIECRTMVTNHQSLDYFIAHYGLMNGGAVIQSFSSMAEPSLSELDDLARRLDDMCVRAVFVELGSANQSAADFAERLDVPLVEIDVESLSHDGGPASSYVGMMRENAAVIATALGNE